jgi:Ca2+-binding RTX toxin-like protein
MAISATFSAGTGVLTTIGDNLDNTITTSRDAAGNILVNGGAVPVQGGTPTVANTGLITTFGLGGNDTISLNETNGALPAALLFGGSGNDVVTGGSGADQIFGEADNDTLLGKGGADLLFGGDGNDVLTGGDGDDQLFGEAGDDRTIWNPGDDTDLAEGGDGNDTLEVNGGNGAETFTITPNGTRFRVNRVDPAPFSIDGGTIENIIITANGGDDVISAGNGLSALTFLNIDGGAGNDTITGGDGGDALSGGDGNDTLTGGRGNDLIFGGAGNDRFIWNSGDGSDVVEGQDGIDTLEINGSNSAETINITANGTRVRVDGVGAAPFILDVGNAENIVINANGGDDIIVAGNGLAALTSLTIDSGAGNDVITGGDGADVLLGGDGNDVVTGGRGDDVALLGAGNDSFFWNPGDGSDTVEGQDGVDALEFNGANVSENIDISANGGRVRFFRDVANVTMDVNDVEGIRFRAFGGADNITIGDLSGTDTTGVVVDLEGTLNAGTGDGQVDTVTVTGTQGDDAIVVRTAGGVIQVVGTTPNVAIFHSEATDRLVINGLGGADVIDASGLVAGQTSLTLNGGLGNDVLIGSRGNDIVFGGDGNDTALLGAGNDSFFWNPGDDNDTVEGQAGSDALEFNGANIAENIDISAIGDRVRFFRDVANVTMDLNEVEGIRFRALGGADNIVINDLSGTDTTGVVVDLEGAIGSGTGDGALDRVTVNGTAGNDTINVALAGGVIQVVGTSPNVAIFHAEATDQLVVNGGNGNDTINAAALPSNTIAVTIDGGNGNDILVGSQRNDVILGGAGNDVLFAVSGVDSLFGGAGQDTFMFAGTTLATLDTGVGANRDVIQDFGGDIVRLIEIDANLNVAGDQAFSFIGTNAFTAAGQVRFFLDGAGNTIVEGNVDGNPGADFQIELHSFTGQLQAGDFLL